jgi:pimeloyl-ACP methyl ester carboxylesterase
MSWWMWIVIASLVWFGLLALLTRSLAAKAGQLVPPLGRFVDLPGCRLHVVEAGVARPGVPPLLMVHGLGGQVRHFSYELVGMLAADTRVVAIDRPGSGWSRRDPGRDASLQTQADTVMALADQLGLDKPLIVGHSLGGALALAIAQRHGARISGVALLAPATHLPKEISPVFRGLVVPSWLRGFVAWTLSAPLVVWQGPKILAVVFGPEAVPADYRDRGGGALSLRPSQFIAASQDLEAARVSIDQLETHYAELAASPLPIHMIFGRQDRILSCEDNAVAFQRSVPNTKLVLVDGGHMLPLTQPAACAALIRAAMADARAASA